MRLHTALLSKWKKNEKLITNRTRFCHNFRVDSTKCYGRHRYKPVKLLCEYKRKQVYASTRVLNCVTLNTTTIVETAKNIEV